MIILPIFNISIDCKTAAVFCLKIGFTGREARGRHKPVGRVAREIFLVPPQSHSPFPPSLQTFPLTARARVLKPRQKCGLSIAICKILSWFNYDRDRIINDDEGITKLRQVLQVFNFLVWGGTSTPPPPPRMNRFIDRIKNNVNVTFLLLFYFVVIKARVAVMFSSDLQVNVEVLEIFKQAGPTFIEKGQEIIIKHE